MRWVPNLSAPVKVFTICGATGGTCETSEIVAADKSRRVRLDLNSPQFQEVFFGLQTAELKQVDVIPSEARDLLFSVAASLRRLAAMDWASLYRHPGLHWEAIEYLKAPNGATVYSLRLSKRIRALAFRDGDFLRLISLHPDHDSAYD